MDIEEILGELKLYTGTFPREAVEAAIAQREEITPHLLAFIEHACENAEHLVDDSDETGGYMGHIYAMFLLAQFRERAAYPPIVRFFSLPEDLCDALAGDIVTESLPNILASVSCGDTTLIREMVENSSLSERVRGSAVRSFLALVASGDVSREEAIECYAELFRGRLEREFSQTWNALASCAADLAARELREDIFQAFDDGLVGSFFISRENVKEDLSRPEDRVPAHLEGQRCGLIEDTVREMSWWACFRKDRSSKSKAKDKGSQPPSSDRAMGDEPTSTSLGLGGAVQVAPKPGRNDLCPCGSGRKYKRCCARKPREAT